LLVDGLKHELLDFCFFYFDPGEKPKNMEKLKNKIQNVYTLLGGYRSFND